jgi:hypothetical protein
VRSATVAVGMQTYGCVVNAQGHPQMNVTAYAANKSANVTARIYATVRLGRSAKTYLASNLVTIPAGSPGYTTVTFSNVTTHGAVHCLVSGLPDTKG